MARTMPRAMDGIEDKMPCSPPTSDMTDASIHIREMSSSAHRTGAAAAAYTPIVPSPLNPRSQEEAARALRRRRAGRALRRRNVGMSPAQRLLRYKAAEAWRTEATRRELARWERRTAAESTARQMKTATLRPDRTTRGDAAALVDVRARHLGLDPREGDGREKSDGEGSEDAEGEEVTEQQDEYLFHMPDLGFFTPRRVVLAVGRMRMLPTLRMDALVRSGETAAT